jgi:hypothetical protein
MALLPTIQHLDAEKLATLQRLDQFREWQSLDEKRYCLVCGSLITGRDIQVIGGGRGTGPLRVICPSAGCHSIPMDWVLPTDEVLAKTGAGGTEHRAPVEAKDSSDWSKGSATSRSHKRATRRPR